MAKGVSIVHGRTKLIVAVVCGIVVALLLAGVLLVRSLLSPPRFTTMLQNGAGSVGLQLDLQGPAQPALWPHPAVRMVGLIVRRDGGGVILTARQADLVVPWSSLLRREARISQLRIEAPHLDLQQMQAWMNERQSDTSGDALSIPSIDAGVRISDGVLTQNNTLMLDALFLETGSLKSGQEFALTMTAQTADERPLKLQLDTVPVASNSALILEPLSIALSAGAPPALQLQGNLHWSGGQALEGALDGKLQLAKGDYATHVVIVPGNETTAAPLHLNLRVDGKDAHANLSLAPTQAWQWWQQLGQGQQADLLLAPVSGTFQADRVDVGSLHIEGLSIESSAPANATSGVPASAGSTPVSASGGTPGP